MRYLLDIGAQQMDDNARINTSPAKALGPRRRRKHGGGSTRPADWLIRQLRPPTLDWVMGGCAALVFATALLSFHGRLTYYPDIMLSVPPQDIIYGFGKPTSTSGTPGNDVWQYDRDGTAVRVRFVDGMVKSSTCVATAAAGECPEIFGIRGHTAEGVIVRQFGWPDRHTYNGNAKSLVYSHLGLTFHLSRFQVQGIALEQRSHARFGFLMQYFRALLPG